MDITGEALQEKASQLLPALALLDYFLPSSYEAMELSGEKTPEAAAAYFHRHGVPVAVIKLGKQGALLSDGRKQKRFSAYEGPVIDTTGAGDAFVSGFLAGISREKELSDCVRLGNGAGALCVGKVGASEHCRLLRNYQLLLAATDLQQYEKYAYRKSGVQKPPSASQQKGGFCFALFGETLTIKH
ncbi:MAG: carbohydrate kinase family protein [[Clostridium] leptum]